MAPDQEPVEDGQHPSERRLRGAMRFLIGVAFGLALVSQSLVTSYRVAGRSMTPAFLDGDRVVVARAPGFFGEPRRGEIVIARVNGEVVIKRVEGVPGDTVELTRGQLLRNGAPVRDPVPERYRDASDFGPERLGSDEFFLLGDHRRISIDSREFGPVGRSQILGRVILRVPTRSDQKSAEAVARGSR